jgi:hypothetical protein
MENQSFLEKIFLYGVVGVTILIFATLFRYISITIGSDDFTANVVFLIVFILGSALYSMILIVLIEVLNLFSKKKVINKEAGENKKVEENIAKVEEDGKENTKVINVVKSDDDELSKIIDKNRQEKARIEKQELEIAIQYTKEKFALYTSKEDLIKLCEYIEIYSSQGNLNAITTIKVKQLKYFDVYHFGWNIWNYFNTPNNRIPQIKIAEFLKNIFKELLKDVGIRVIKSHLKTEPMKGFIKIEENITNLTEHNQSA